jgi:signal transduction histidine kinase/ABC-type uncharacterized transport system substrate-binding protein
MKQEGQQQLGACGAKRLSLALAAFCLLWPSTATAQVREVRRVLVFMEGNLSTPAVAAADREISTGLEKSPFAIERYSEYTETVLFPSETSYRKLREWYRDREPDIIIAAGPSPIKFLAESHEKLFGDTPIVFCGSSEEQADHPKLDSHFTGVWITIAPKKTLEAALQLQPSTQRVVVVGGVSSYDKSVEAIVREQLRGYESKVEFEYLTDLAMPALLERLRHLSNNTLVLYTSLTTDAAGRDFIAATESVPMVVNVANAPVFALADTLIGQGTVGGYVVSFAAQGKVAAAITMRVLQGETPQGIPIVRGANVFIFDWRALRRWGFKESALPPGSIVLNRQPTVWQSYGRYILGAALFGLAQTLLILGLLWQRARKRKVETSLAERLAFEGLLSDLSTTFINLPEEQVDSNIEKSLGRIAEFLEIERITLFECSQEGTGLTVTSCWTSEGAEPILPNSKPIPWPWWESRGLTGEPLTFSDPYLSPDEAPHIRRYLLESGIQSIASVPLRVGGEIVGALSFVSTKRRVTWTDDLIRQLKVLAEIFSNALKRKRALQALLASNTELKRSEGVLRENEERLRLAVQAGRMYAFEWEAATDAIVRSGECVHIFNWMDDPMRDTGREFAARVHPDDRARYAATETGHTGENPVYQTSFRMLRPDGSVIWLEESGHAFFDDEGGLQHIIGMVADVTERKLAEEALSSVSRRLIEAQELERARIARELHDDLSQRMALLHIGLEQFAQDAAGLSSKTRQQLRNITKVSSEVSSNLHDLSHQLHPFKLDALGLVFSLGGFCREFSEQHHVQVEFVHHDISEQIPKDVTLCLFRIAQEALRNVVKHSGAAEAKVELSSHGDGIDLCISDSGAGFSPESARGERGLGLISMRERLRLVRGHLSVESEPSRGTRIRVRVPLSISNAGVTSEEKADKAGA